MSRYRGTLSLLLIAGASTLAAQQHGNPSDARPMYHYPRWSPDGRSLIAVAMSSSGSRLVIVPTTGGAPIVVSTGSLEPTAADWTPGGRLSFLADSSGTTRRYVVDRDGRHRTAAPADSISAATRDSSIMIFERHRGAGSDIVALNRERTSARQLTTGFWAEQPSISPDGRTIVFERRFDPNNMAASDVVIMALDGSGQRAIARGTDPSWSPDGKTILFKSFQRAELWVTTIDVATSTQRRLARGVHPQWSPDGTRIAYMQDTPKAGADIYVIGKDGSANRCLTCLSAAR